VFLGAIEAGHRIAAPYDLNEHSIEMKRRKDKEVKGAVFLSQTPRSSTTVL
jgi:hypothetical protein